MGQRDSSRTLENILHGERERERERGGGGGEGEQLSGPHRCVFLTSVGK